MNMSGAKHLKELETENACLDEAMLENKLTKEALRKSGERTGQVRTGTQHCNESGVGSDLVRYKPQFCGFRVQSHRKFFKC
jgi:hypothetical protein